MKIKLIFLKKGLDSFFGIKPEFLLDLYFCAPSDGNNKTSHLLKHLMNGDNSWVSMESCLDGIITFEKWIEVKGEFEKWLIEKIKEFNFLIDYNKPNIP